jgi:adenylyltransferase/sulfurtransferase
VGHLTVVDRDFVEPSNLQRQSLFNEQDAAKNTPKAIAAERVLRSINSSIEVNGVVADVTFENITELCRDADLIFDGSDNFEVRFLINDYSVQEGIPWVYGAALGSYGISFAVVPGNTPCLRCLFNEPPAVGSVETCETAGILAPVIHAVCSKQVAQSVRLLVGEKASHRILQIDIWDDEWKTVELQSPLEGCECCSQRRFPYLDGRLGSRMTRLCGRNAVQVHSPEAGRIVLNDLANKLSQTFEVELNEYLVRFKVNEHDISIFADGRAIIKGTDDLSLARSLYSRYVGN